MAPCHVFAMLLSDDLRFWKSNRQLQILTPQGVAMLTKGPYTADSPVKFRPEPDIECAIAPDGTGIASPCQV